MMLCRLLIVTIASVALLQTAVADDKPEKTEKTVSALSIFGKKQDPASLKRMKESRMTVAELRQARALLKADQRRARMERNAWMGHEPLRPTFNTVPMMRSRYENRTIYIPVYWYR